VSSSDPKPEGGCVSCVGNTVSPNPKPGVESPVGLPVEGAFEPVDSTGVESPVWTPVEGAFGPLGSTGVKTPTEGTGGSLPEVGTNELDPVEGK